MSSKLMPKSAGGDFLGKGFRFTFGMPQVVAAVVADGQIVLVAVATFAQRLNVL
jgi:hypothetical protein